MCSEVTVSSSILRILSPLLPPNTSFRFSIHCLKDDHLLIYRPTTLYGLHLNKFQSLNLNAELEIVQLERPLSFPQPLKLLHFSFCLCSALLIPFWKQLKNTDKNQNYMTGHSMKQTLVYEQEPVVLWLISFHHFIYPLCHEKPTSNRLILPLQFLD